MEPVPCHTGTPPPEGIVHTTKHAHTNHTSKQSTAYTESDTLVSVFQLQ